MTPSPWAQRQLDECPDRAKHYAGKDEPSGYVAWHEWVERKGNTHNQLKCPGCGLYAIWKKKPSKSTAAAVASDKEGAMH